MLALKPNLFVALVPLTLALLVARRSWRSVAVTSISLAALTLAAIALDPRWLGSLAHATTKVSLSAPTTWSLAASVTPSVAALTVGVLFVASAGAVWSSIRDAPQRLWDATFVAAATALSIVLTPYAHLYDYLLLAPAIAVAIAALERRGRVSRVLALLTYGGGFLVVTWIAFLNGPHGDEPPINALIPLATVALLALAMHWGSRAGVVGPRLSPSS